MVAKRFGQALAEALSRVEKQAQQGIVKSADIQRTDRERLQHAGWLQPIMKGWYLLGQSDDAKPGSTTPWFGHFWGFIRYYLSDRYGENYCLSAECSLDLHTDATSIPRQVVAMTATGGANTLTLPHNTSLLVYPDPANLPSAPVRLNELRVMALPLALCRAAPRYFEFSPMNAELALRLADPVELSRILLEGAHTRAASRLMGAYQFIGETERAERIKGDMAAVGYRISPVNPFQTERPLLGAGTQLSSPLVGRLRALWEGMRETVIDIFPKPPGLPADSSGYRDSMEDIYQHDAYNSLSIEGYQVTPALIEKVRLGQWNPDASLQDQAQVAALAARGYYETFQRVESTIGVILSGEDAADSVRANLQDWYRALFSASVQAGILAAADLAGYRNRPVYIRGSNHVPPSHRAVMDGMDTLFELLKQEDEPIVRAVLGHFLFVFIHPYPDGNGRLGRFLMNTLLASGGYPWTVIRLKRRQQYMDALEQASVGGDIRPFSEFVREEMAVDWRHEVN
ncbi:A4orf02 protein [hydrothermal vent metagenome]|uniref:A4orf02 protein n=1 Tax=hydrothermal vent metagenome TaxID=652676 RepID=A0A3B1ADR4_9ZZZZ